MNQDVFQIKLAETSERQVTSKVERGLRDRSQMLSGDVLGL